MDPAIAEGLIRVGIDVITVRDLGLLGDTDPNHLRNATEMGRVLCTQDTDFLSKVSEDFVHAGIAFGEHYGSTIGGWVRALRALHASTTAEEMVGQ